MCPFLYFIPMQVLSGTVSNAIKLTGGPNAQGTATFIDNCDKFFDCLNVDNCNEGIHSKKDFQRPYTKKDDFRLKVCNYCMC